MDNDTLLGILVCSLLTLLVGGGVGFLVLGTVFKTRFGINLGTAACSDCGEPAPTIRAPADSYEMTWGGWTCEVCGQKNDKWGRPRSAEKSRRRKKRRR